MCLLSVGMHGGSSLPWDHKMDALLDACDALQLKELSLGVCVHDVPCAIFEHDALSTLESATLLCLFETPSYTDPPILLLRIRLQHLAMPLGQARHPHTNSLIESSLRAPTLKSLELPPLDQEKQKMDGLYSSVSIFSKYLHLTTSLSHLVVNHD